MANITPARRNVQIEEVQYKSAVSEATFSKLGGSINFINTYQYYQLYFGMGGNYGTSSLVPGNGIGSLEVFDQNAELVNVWVYSGTAGTSGTTTLDLKFAPVNSSTYTSIFSTTPSVTSAAASGVFFDANSIATLPTGCTKPVLSKTLFNAGDKIRCDISSIMAAASNFIVIIHWRPR
jgi:hypothetical protein